MSNVILTTIPLSFHNRITYVRKVKNRYDVGNINLFPNKCTSKCQYILHVNYYWNVEISIYTVRALLETRGLYFF